MSGMHVLLNKVNATLRRLLPNSWPLQADMPYRGLLSKIDKAPLLFEGRAWLALLQAQTSSEDFYQATHAWLKRYGQCIYRFWLQAVFVSWSYDVTANVAMLWHASLSILPGYTQKWADRWQPGLWNRRLAWSGGPRVALYRLCAWPMVVLWAVLACCVSVLRPITALLFHPMLWAKHVLKGGLYILGLGMGLLAYPLRMFLYGWQRGLGLTMALSYWAMVITRAWPLFGLLFKALYPVHFLGLVLFGLPPLSVSYGLLVVSTAYVGHWLYGHTIPGLEKPLGQLIMEDWFPILKQKTMHWHDHVTHLIATVVWMIYTLVLTRMFALAMHSVLFAGACLQMVPAFMVGTSVIVWVSCCYALWPRVKITALVVKEGLGLDKSALLARQQAKPTTAIAMDHSANDLGADAGQSLT